MTLVIILIIFLFVAVAVVLPLTLRISGKRSKAKGKGSAAAETITSPTPPIPAVEPAPEQTETQPALTSIENLAATSPSLRTVAAEHEPETLPVSGERPAQVKWRIAGLSDTGLRRELNEDNLVMLEKDTPIGLYVVADGMGGHDAGEIASDLTIKAVQYYFDEHTPADSTPLNEWLKGAAVAANKVVLAQQGDRAEERKMGSTLVMALVTEGQAHIANVGDSRAYRLTADHIEQISTDHSLVERLVQIGQLTREEARVHKQKNVIYSTIGDKEEMEIGLYQTNLQPGNRLLLCSDGLSGMLADEEILQLSRANPDPATACKALVEAAKMAGGHDNITALIVEMDE
ncbi:MAG: Stp1/IreP family PP2C-type Ser/Thr phosphatase [Anaerolineae bacterium]